VRNHALIDGNSGWLGSTIAFLGVNGRRLTLSNDQAYELIIEVVTVSWTRLPASPTASDAEVKPPTYEDKQPSNLSPCRKGRTPIAA